MAYPTRPYQCSETMAHVDEFIDAELSAAEYDRIDDHLEQCPRCRQRFARHVLLKSMIQKACQCDCVPDDVRSQIRSRISELNVNLGGAKFHSLSIHTERTVSSKAEPTAE